MSLGIFDSDHGLACHVLRHPYRRKTHANAAEHAAPAKYFDVSAAYRNSVKDGDRSGAAKPSENMECPRKFGDIDSEKRDESRRSAVQQYNN
jgi:hypothetical protein